ncbi:CPBP family intramembrane metalloprotease [Psychrobacillus sp. PGGUH221]|uniref:CPBP family glutamic-type intramembrane protease n=1 Tax=Psychrobacillus sp. PGGUH221 TaxID=3020058 RepID=UPI0035C75D71
MNKSDNILWASILLLCITNCFFTEQSKILILFWVISIIFVGNAKKMYSKRYNKTIVFFRRSMYIVPYLIPFFFLGFGSNLLKISLLEVITASLLGLLFIILDYKTWLYSLNKDFILMQLEFMSNKPNKFFFLMNTYTFIFGAIAEEMFFRVFIIYLFRENLFIGFFLSIILFIVAHFGTKWGDSFSKKDFYIQLCFSVFSALLFIFTWSIFPSIIAHLSFNLFHVIKEYRIYYFSKGATIRE